ncbi:Vacuolar protein-sorting protein BRO1 [Spathaspora sp. JA1]|nr:Vacuolar protein-sorting protein BRO1 [Spathaspora sp. JA1]
MKTHLLIVPNKKTEEVNWIKPLNNYLLSIYGNTSGFQDDLNSFNKLRQDIRGVNADNTGLNLYYKYYSQLELLDLRIPFANVNKHKKLEFEWFDSFTPSVAIKQAALPFEKANVLFNLAALMTKYAKSKYDESIQESSEAKDDATKSTIQMLQSAAGVYQFINENFLHAPSDDLSQPTIKFLCKLMLAQSQEVFTLKVITNDLEQKKNSLISKLCKSTSKFYEDCYNMINHNKKQSWDYYDDDDDDESESYEAPHKRDEEDSDSYVTANLDVSWISTIYMKYLYYNALAYYFHGLNLEANRKYGDAIAYLSKSQGIIKQINSATLRAISMGIGDVYELLDNYKYQKDALEIKLNDLNKDNDLIYHDIVPSLVTIPDIKPMDSTKIIPIGQHSMLQEVNEQNYTNFLNNVVPINIHELSSFYSEEKSQFLRNEMDLVDVSNEEVESVLEYLKLPKSLIEIKELVNLVQDNDDIPSSEIKDKVSEIAASYTQDSQNRTSIESLRKQILETISACDSKLSGSFSNKDELIQLKKVLYDATNSDQKLFSLVDPSFHSLYAKGPDSPEFSQLFKISQEPKQTNAPEISLLDIDDNKKPDSSEISSNIKRLEDILHDIHMAKSQKMKLMDKLKTEIHNDDISDILILNSKLKSTNEIRTVIFPEELNKFKPYNEELDKLVTKEKSFINDLKSIWNNLVTNPQVKNLTVSRKALDKKIVDSTASIIEFYDNWNIYHAGLIKGQQFYQGLLNHASNVKNEIEMGIKMNEGFKNMNVGSQQFTGGSQQQHFTGGSQQQQQQFTGGSQEGYRSSTSQNYSYPSTQSSGQGQNQPYSSQGYQPQQQFPPQTMLNRSDAYQTREQYPYQQQSQQEYQPQARPQQYHPQSYLTLSSPTSSSTETFGQRQPQVTPQQPPALIRPSTFESTPPMTYTPPVKPPRYEQAPEQPQGYTRAPQLPPKQPSFDQTTKPQPQAQGQVPWNQGENNKSNNSLIYDQPSTYNPNMYNFFSSS